MPSAEFEGYPYQSDKVFIHFDVADHQIDLETFVSVAKSVNDAVIALNVTLFHVDFRVQIVVVPPKEGSFLQTLKIVVPSLAALVLFVDSDTPAAFVKGLTGKTPSEWALDAGIDTYDLLVEESRRAYEGFTDDTNASFPDPRPDFDSLICEAGAKMLAAMVKEVFEKEAEDLISLGGDEIELDALLNARADFYQACISNREIKRVGFGPDSDFPIPRSTFPARAQRPAKREPDEEGGTWHTAIEDVFVSSPNWDEDDQHSRQWKGKNTLGRTCYFVINDEVFWKLAESRHLQVGVLDTLKVQWIYQTTEGKTKNRQVLRVLAINGEVLSSPMSLDSVSDILHKRAARLEPEGGPTLFDDLEDWGK
ncbi:hypothetical protein RMR16_020255 [Agrobacterium sp. rho-13.3]|uniref:hypothetical protein n=1 Tax=Agrobacterium sp. rho-13.3 TaxID=3072980 RepID=UPI002A0F7A35|nr:hypothetical protein [Agrobacterium sp. rho-13.3]MDX8306237.1 hypothetical protein [Agrobacterium sp. rho-13.3]MDX8307432.1 hypothetical protein [Agrobacterium sp. rho-13.3]